MRIDVCVCVCVSICVYIMVVCNANFIIHRLHIGTIVVVAGQPTIHLHWPFHSVVYLCSTATYAPQLVLWTMTMSSNINWMPIIYVWLANFMFQIHCQYLCVLHLLQCIIHSYVILWCQMHIEPTYVHILYVWFVQKRL